MFNSLSLGRNRNSSNNNVAPTPTSRSTSETLSAHPLLGSSSPSLESSLHASGPDDLSKSPGSTTSLPYKPRQRHGGGAGSQSNASSFMSSSITNPINSSQSAPTLNVLSASKTPQPSAVTTASPAFASSNPGPSGQAGGSVTSRLQLQSLKAAGQRMGLGNGSAGIQMLESLFEKGQISRSGSGGDWGEIIKVLTAGKATLLLPSSPASSLPVTTQSLRDHIMFPACGTNAGTVFVTMSGLIGVVEEGKITFESCLSGDNGLLQAIKDPNSRSSALSSLQPLRASTSSNVHFPSFTTTATNGSLPFPPLPPPPQPPANSGNRSRSGSNASLSSIPPIASSRLNPFATLFGSSASSGNAAHIPATPPKAVKSEGTELSSSPSALNSASILSPRPASIASLPPSEASQEGATAASEPEGFQLPAWSIDKVIKYGEVCKSLGKAVRRNVSDELDGLPEKVIERAARFVLASHPCSAEIKNAPGTPLLSVTSPMMDAPLNFHAKADHVSESLQHFLESVYDDLFAQYSTAVSVPQSPSALGSLRRRGSQKGKNLQGGAEDSEKAAEDASKREKQRLAAEEAAERLATQGVDQVEKPVCCLLYNSLFAPLTADDSKHDEALSSRVAALNLLDLSLDHLGVKTKENDPENADPSKEERDKIVADGLESLVERVGKVLQTLEAADNHAPKSKSDILVLAHKVVIDGLQKLPTIRLRPDGDVYQGGADTPPQPTEIDQALNMPDESTDSQVPSIPPPQPARSVSPTTKPAEENVSATSDVSPNQTPKPEKPLREPSLIPEIRLPDSVDESDLQEALQDSILLSGKPTVIEPTDTEVKLSGGTSGADLLLPIIIYAIVKANPNRLVSHLLYTQRYRSAVATSGEAQYAIVNMTAAVEFLENVDLAELGLSSAEKVLSVTDLEPIGLNHYYHDKDVDTASIVSASSRLRGRVSQVGELAGSAAGSANKVLTGVVDSSWTALRGLMVPNLGLKPLEEESTAQGEAGIRPKLNPRRASAFTLASVTATVANIANATTQRQRAKTISAPPIAEDRELRTVTSRPASIRETSESSDSDHHSDHDDHSGGSETEGIDDPVRRALGRNRQASDVRSIKSVSSMLSKPDTERLSIHERFANLGLNRNSDEALTPHLDAGKGQTSFFNSSRSAGASRRTSLLNPVVSESGLAPPTDSPGSQFSHSTSLPPFTAEDLAPPIEQFMEGNVADLRISDIGALLRDYRRMGDVITRLKAELEKDGQ